MQLLLICNIICQKETKEIERVYLLKDQVYDLLIISESSFETLFELVDDTKVKMKDYDWHPMSGGSDTFLQSCAFLHIRSGIGYGKHEMHILGIYQLV